MTSKLHRNVPRDMAAELQSLGKQYPVVTILGPRQSGKTTLVRDVFPEKMYINLEDPDTREQVEYDPRGFLERNPEGLILDEIQNVPKLLSYIQGIVDKDQKNGQFILTGSHQPLLSQGISQSLAGRTAILNLLPLSCHELQQAQSSDDLYQTLYKGFYPRIYKDDLDPTKFYRNYVETYLERDVRQMINIKDLRQFQVFLKLCAGRIGQLLNMNSLATEVGVSSHTIKNWMNILEASYVIHILQPFHVNISKRLIKSPKLYFVDPGLACFLLDIRDPQQIERDPLRGSLFENLVVMDLVKTNLNYGLEKKFYFYRDSNHNEIDIVYKNGEFTGIEIKLSQTFQKSFLKGLDHIEIGIDQGFVVYTGQESVLSDKRKLLNYRDTRNILKEPLK